MTLNSKLKQLKQYLKNLEIVVVAFSSGVDSTFLLKIAHDTLNEKAVAVTAKSCSFPNRELAEAAKFCELNNIKHIIFDFDVFNVKGFKDNPQNRCYLCKKELFSKIRSIAKENEITNIIEGSNLDDEVDYRPGMKAVKELNIKSPLRELGFTKDEIRKLSKELGLPTFEKPSFACLASRFVYGETITKEKIKMVDMAEQLLLDLGFHQVRVRIHSDIARIEVEPNEMQKIMDNRNTITHKLKELGFSYVTLDLLGYRTGSMNERINIKNNSKLF